VASQRSWREVRGADEILFRQPTAAAVRSGFLLERLHSFLLMDDAARGVIALPWLPNGRPRSIVPVIRPFLRHIAQKIGDRWRAR